MSIFNGTVLDIVSKNALQLVEGDIFKAVFERKEVRLLVEELNRKRLQKGKNTDGSPIKNLQTGKSTYSITTEEIYKKIGRRITAGSPYTMKFTGKFYTSIKVKNVTANYFEVDAQPIKEDGTNLFTTYGDFLIGASDEDFNTLRTVALPLILEYTRNILGANL